MNGRAQALLVLVYGLVVVRVARGSDLTTFVRPGVGPLVLASGAVITSVAALALVRGARSSSRAVWLILAPIAVFTIIDPPPLGVSTAARPPSTPARPDHGFPRLAPHGVVPLTVSQIVLRMVWGERASLRRRTVRTEGFVSGAVAGGFVLTRLVITCCAADAAPYDVEVRTTPGVAPPSRGTWVEVTGTVTGTRPGSDNVPVLRSRSVTAVPRPADPYG